MINKDDHILITGGTGFLGSHLVDALRIRGYKNLTILGRRHVDLQVENEVNAVFRLLQPNVVIHAAAVCGGIGANKEAPARFLEENTRMNLNVIDACIGLHNSKCGFKKVIGIGSVCSYPKFAPVPFREEDLWNGYPEETNAGYGLSKRLLLAHIQAARQQHGLPGIFLIPVNLYGPRDCFNEGRSHVIPALIKRMNECMSVKEGFRHHSLACWGTGSASREFFHVRDAAEGIILAMEKYNKPEPVNLGNGREITIKELTEMLANVMKFDGYIVWDSTKPDGQPRRCLDVRRAREEFGFEAKVPFEQGLKETVEWYKQNGVKR